MLRFAPLLLAVALASCGYRTDEYALNRSALAPGIGVVGGSVIGVNPVSGELIGAGVGAGSGTPVRSLGNPEHERYDPRRLGRPY